MTAGAMVDLESVLSEAPPVDRPLDFLDNEFVPSLTDETMDVVCMVNDVDYGLAASVWTCDVSRAMRSTRDLDFGTVWVNAHLAVTNEMPWVGFGSSGIGHDMSTKVLDDYTRNKHVMIKQ